MNTGIYSWNVNGLRAIISKGELQAFMTATSPDVLCLQEIKARPEDVKALPWDDYHCAWNPANKRGYSGTLTLSREKPLAVTLGIGLPDHDNEGRVLTCEFPEYFIVNTYTPNSQQELARLPYRLEWDAAYRSYLLNLNKLKPVIALGDFNVAHQEIDLANPKSNRRNAGFTDEERQSFGELLGVGFVDSFRIFEKGGGHYSWWTYRQNARERNVGWRIDYVLVSQDLVARVKKAKIYPQFFGSDHCPVSIDLLS